MTCIWKGNDLDERKEGVSIISHWKRLWMKELPGPKVLRIAPTVVSLTMSTAEKPISYCSLRGYLALTSCLPMEKRSMTKTAWRQGGDVTPPMKHWTLTVYISRPICNLTKPATEPWQYIRGCINNNNDHVIKDNHRVSLSFYMTQAAVGKYSLTGWVDVCSWQGVGDTHHFLIRELPSLDAATVSHGLLVSLALGVAEQVHLWGDLQTQTERSEVTAAGTMETEAGKGQQSPMGRWWNDIPHGLFNGIWPASPEPQFKALGKGYVICYICYIMCNLAMQIRCLYNCTLLSFFIILVMCSWRNHSTQ